MIQYVRSGERVENFRVERKEASRRVFPHLYYRILYVGKEARKRERERNDVGMINIRLQ